MKALFFHKGKNELIENTLPKPEPKAHEVVIKLCACGICGTDVHIAREFTIPTAFSPIVLGHEPAGVIAEVGSDVTDWQIGDRVVTYPSAFCGSCISCKNGREGLCMKGEIFGLMRHGALAEFMTAPARGLVKLPDSIPFEVGAILTDAVSTPYHAVVKRAQLEKGETAAIFGVGGLGSQAVRFCKLFGAAQIIAVDINESALELAKKIGATHMVNAGDDIPAHKQIRGLTDGMGVDAAFEFIGRTDTIEMAVKSLRRGGRVVVSGIGMEKMVLPPIRSFVGNEYEVRGSMGLDMEDLQDVMALVESGKLDLSDAVKPVGFEDVNDALSKLARGQSEHARYVLSHGLGK